MRAWCARHPVIVDLSVLALFVLCVFPQTLTNTQLFFFEDHRGAFAAWREAAEAFGRGDLPLWTGAMFSGYPFFADAQTEVFYPPAVLFRLLFPAVLSYNLYLPFTLFVAAANQYVLCRYLGISRPAAVVAAFAFSAGFPLTNQISSFSCAATVAWFPGIVAATLHLSVAPGLKSAALLAALLGFQSLAGNYQFVAMTVVLSAFLLIAYRPTWRGACWFGVAGGWALLLSAIQLIPSVELFSLSVRAQATGFPDATRVSPIQWLSLFSPDHFGNPAEDTYWIAFDPVRYIVSTPYLGIAIPVLFFLFVVSLRDRRDVVILSAAVLCGLLAMGPYTPLAKILGELPIFSQFRAPSRWLQPFAVFLSLGAAIGLDRLRTAPSSKSLWMGVSFLVAMLLVSAWAKGFPVPSIGPTEVSPIQHERIREIAHPRDLLFAIAFGAVTAAILFLVRRDRRFAIGFLPLIAIDLSVHGAHLRPVAPASIVERPENLRAIMPIAGRIFRTPTFHDPLHYAPEHTKAWGSRAGWAFGLKPYLNPTDTWPPGAGLLHGVEAIDGVSAFCLDRYRRLLRGADFGSIPVFRPTPEVLDLLGVRYQAYPVVARPSAFERAFFVEEWVSADDAAVEQAIEKGGVDFRRVAFVAGEESGRDARCREATVARTGAFSFETRSDARCLLVVSDPHYPGWTARVDGAGIPIVRTNLALRGVWVPPGEHRIDFAYHPLSLRIGAAVSVFAWVLLLVAAGCRSRRSARFSQPRPDGSQGLPFARRARWAVLLFAIAVSAAGAIDGPKLWEKNLALLHYPSAAKRVALMFALGLEREGEKENAERHRAAALRMP